MAGDMNQAPDPFGPIRGALRKLSENQERAPRHGWGIVTSIAPLRVRPEFDTVPLEGTPATLVVGLKVGDRVMLLRHGRRAIIIGKGGGQPTIFGHAGYSGVSYPGGGVVPIAAAQEAIGITFDGGLYGFLIPEDGVYEISAQAVFTGAAVAQAGAAILQASTTIALIYVSKPATSIMTGHATVRRTFTAGTLIRLYAYTEVGSIVADGYRTTYLEVTRIR